MRAYTKADLEQIVLTQLENLNAMNDLLRIMKVQNELLDQVNRKLKDETYKADKNPVASPAGRKRKGK